WWRVAGSHSRTARVACAGWSFIGARRAAGSLTTSGGSARAAERIEQVAARPAAAPTFPEVFVLPDGPFSRMMGRGFPAPAMGTREIRSIAQSTGTAGEVESIRELREDAETCAMDGLRSPRRARVGWGAWVVVTAMAFAIPPACSTRVAVEDLPTVRETLVA